MQKISQTMLVISDSHFLNQIDENASKFFNFFENVDLENLEYFVLLGDIFDFYFGAGVFFKKKFSRFHELFDKLSKNNVKVIFIQGNHEFCLGGVDWGKVEVVTNFEKKITISDGTQFVFTHGDRLLAPPSYFWYLRVTRSRIFSLIARFLPQKRLDDLALAISRKSRSKDKYRILDHEKVLNSVNNWIGQHDHAHGIFGHFHHPYFEKRKDNKGFVISMDSWWHPNFLGYKDSRFVRINLENEQLHMEVIDGN